MTNKASSTYTENFHGPLKSLLEKFVGEAIDDLQDGFINGEEDLWKWIEFNVKDYNISSAPPAMNMMANMKSQQQMNMLRQ